MTVLSASQIAGYAAKAGVTGANIGIATAIALAESSGNTTATNHNSNGSTDYGLWQINSVHSDLLATHNWQDPADNAAMMFSISNGGTNWRPWSTYTSGAYSKYLSQTNGVTPDTSVTGGVVTTASTGSDPFTSFQQLATAISNPRNWVRFGMVIGGGMLILSAVHMSHPLPKVPGVAKIAAKAAML